MGDFIYSKWMYKVFIWKFVLVLIEWNYIVLKRDCLISYDLFLVNGVFFSVIGWLLYFIVWCVRLDWKIVLWNVYKVVNIDKKCLKEKIYVKIL